MSSNTKSAQSTISRYLSPGQIAIWPIPEQPFPPVTFGARWELGRQVGSCSWACSVWKKGTDDGDMCRACLLQLSYLLYPHAGHPRRKRRTWQCWEWSPSRAAELKGKQETKTWSACAHLGFFKHLCFCSWRGLILFPPSPLGVFSPCSEGVETLMGGCPYEPCCRTVRLGQESDLTAPQGFCFPQVWYLLN